MKCNKVSIFLFADKFRLNQVFLDIINNAINNIVQEGEIIVSLERQDNDNNNTVLVRIIY